MRIPGNEFCVDKPHRVSAAAVIFIVRAVSHLDKSAEILGGKSMGEKGVFNLFCAKPEMESAGSPIVELEGTWI